MFLFPILFIQMARLSLDADLQFLKEHTLATSGEPCRRESISGHTSACSVEGQLRGAAYLLVALFCAPCCPHKRSDV